MPRRLRWSPALAGKARASPQLRPGLTARRLRSAAVAGAALIAAGLMASCGGSSAVTDANTGSSDPQPGPQADPTPDSAAGPEMPDASETTAGVQPSPAVPDPLPEDIPSALDDPRHPDFPEPLVDPAEIRPGGPPPDGIPSIDEPRFEPASEVDWLAGAEAVLALEAGGEARAYPLRIMIWHELVNDVVGGVPVTVSYCPLCNSAVAYDRRLGPHVLDFGTSGRLLNSSLVMYDRQTESLWAHFTGQAIIGYLAGAELDLVPVQTVSFDTFLAAHPDGAVLSLETGYPGYAGRYGQNPYVGYDDPDGAPFLYRGPTDDRLPPMTRVLAVRGDGPTAAVPLDALRRDRVVSFAAQGRDLIALYAPGTASALDTADVAAGRDVGATGVFWAEADGRPITVEPAGDGIFADAADGSLFDILGRRQNGPGPDLTPVEHLDTFWFAVTAFDPETEIAAG